MCFAESTSRVGKLSHLQQGDGLWPSCQQVSTDKNVHKYSPLPNTFTTIFMNETSANTVFVCFLVFLLDLTPCSCEFQKTDWPLSLISFTVSGLFYLKNRRILIYHRYPYLPRATNENFKNYIQNWILFVRIIFHFSYTEILFWYCEEL